MINLGKRAEAYVKFNFWCREHKISGRIAAECIELCNRAQRKHRAYQRNEILDQVKERLEKVGATEIEFHDGWPYFVSAIGERTQLPMKEFI